MQSRNVLNDQCYKGASSLCNCIHFQLLQTMQTKELRKIGRTLFNRLPILNIKTGNKIAKKALKGPTIASWHTKPFTSSLPKGDIYHKMIQEERDNELLKLRRNGKGTPKKGAGKRSKKKR